MALNIKGSTGSFKCSDCGCSISRRNRSKHVGSAACLREAVSEQKLGTFLGIVAQHGVYSANRIPSLTLKELIKKLHISIENGVARITEAGNAAIPQWARK